jgi:hypothetical protein
MSNGCGQKPLVMLYMLDDIPQKDRAVRTGLRLQRALRHVHLAYPLQRPPCMCTGNRGLINGRAAPSVPCSSVLAHVPNAATNIQEWPLELILLHETV